MSKAPLATSTPFSTFKATPPLIARSTLLVRSPRLVAARAAFSAPRSMPVVASVLQFNLATGVVTALPCAALFSRASTPYA